MTRTENLPKPSFLPFTAIILALGAGACTSPEDFDEPDETWLGEEKDELENVVDLEPALLEDDFDSSEFRGAGWTKWYDRDNPSGTKDWEQRHLQSGVCDQPTGVECRTVGGQALWQTGEVVSCTASGGLLCRNSDQPDGDCDYDYKVRFLCPDEDEGDACLINAVDVNCVGFGVEYFCNANILGNCPASAYEFDWSYVGNGNLIWSYDTQAEVIQNQNCDPEFFHTISVNVTDEEGNVVSDWAQLDCEPGGPSPIELLQ